MTTITLNEQLDRDWDWYASDREGMIGHFTTAGMRRLPKTIEQDRDTALRLIHYFDIEAPKSFSYVVRAGVEVDAGGWRDESVRRRYLASFVDMASAGLFSYNTFLSGPGKYYLVAFPEKPIHIDQLPLEIRDLAIRTQSPYPFAKTTYISEEETREW